MVLYSQQFRTRPDLALCTLNRSGTRDDQAERITSFPPGYPERRYIYHVPGSSLTFECFGFTVREELNSNTVHNLLARAIRPFADPAKRRFPAERMRHSRDGFWWEEEAQDGSLTYLYIHLPTEPKLDYSQMAYTIFGMLQIAMDYPHLAFNCVAQDEYESGLMVIAYPTLGWSELEAATAR